MEPERIERTKRLVVTLTENEEKQVKMMAIKSGQTFTQFARELFRAELERRKKK